MGFMTEGERRERIAVRNAIIHAQDAARSDERRRIANKIVMVLTDNIVADIVRPGPVPEERECYDMAHEIREHRLTLTELVLAVLNTEHVGKPDPAA